MHTSPFGRTNVHSSLMIASQPQSPFRPSTLLTRGWFVDHCKKHGVIVTLKDLEELHRLGILYPAVRLQLYAVPFRKIFAPFDGVKEWRFVYKDHTDRFETEAVEIQMYYSTESIFIHENDWLHKHHEESAISYPAQMPYFPWEKCRHVFFTPDKEKAENTYELFYDRRQLVALQYLREHLRHFSDFSPMSIGSLGRSAEFLREKMAAFNRFLVFLLDAERMYEFASKTARARHADLCRAFGEENIENEWALYREGLFLPAIRKCAKRLLKQHRMSIRKMEWWQWQLSELSALGHRQGRSSIAALDEALLQQEESNRMIALLNWMIFALTGEDRTVQGVLLGDHQPRCTECRMPFDPKPHIKNQETCGDPACVNAHRNKKKREKRLVKA